ncbi:heavy-metal-associated domain-containing protein, partial [Candidatus Sumerlaeota bacterium]|nr:heavy-metal-associated domain-containing protein [Candidatus Sumerlaeota bacterium]
MLLQGSKKDLFVRQLSGHPTEFTVLGLHCEACVSAVRNALQEVRGVRSVTVELDRGRTTVETDPDFSGPSALDLAVREAGYETDLIAGATSSKGRKSAESEVSATPGDATLSVELPEPLTEPLTA